MHIEALQLRFALAKLPPLVMKALMSARILAADREENDKLRPLALGSVHRRFVSKAVCRVFQGRVAVALGVEEHSIGRKSRAELLHKAVLVALDWRTGIVKASFDVSNAYNEYDRGDAAQSVQDHVPDTLPWAKASLSTTTYVEELQGAVSNELQMQNLKLTLPYFGV